MSEMFDFKNYQWRKMANNGEKWRKMAMANLPFPFVKFAISPLAPPPLVLQLMNLCTQWDFTKCWININFKFKQFWFRFKVFLAEKSLKVKATVDYEHGTYYQL